MKNRLRIPAYLLTCIVFAVFHLDVLAVSNITLSPISSASLSPKNLTDYTVRRNEIKADLSVEMTHEDISETNLSTLNYVTDTSFTLQHYIFSTGTVTEQTYTISSVNVSEGIQGTYGSLQVIDEGNAPTASINQTEIPIISGIMSETTTIIQPQDEDCAENPIHNNGISDQKDLASVTSTWTDAPINSTPYSRIVKIQSSFTINGNYDSYDGTGFLVAPNVVLTAGHMVYDKNAQQYADSVSAYVKYEPSAQNPIENTWVHTATAITSTVDKQYITASNEGTDPPCIEYDWALITFNSNLANYCTDFFEIMTVLGSLKNYNCKISGYQVGSAVQKYSTGFVTTSAPRRIYYDISTPDGYSGSPVFDPTTLKAFAIHVRGSSVFNNPSGVRITPIMYAHFSDRIDYSIDFYNWS